MVEVHERYIRQLEQNGLNRELEALPTDEVLEERQGDGGGLTPPEVAILLSYTKLALEHDLLGSTLPDEPAFASELERYFPTKVREQFGGQLRAHSLRREIIVAQVANELVNRCGTTFLFRLQEETGASPDDVARAFTAARELYSFRSLWAEIEALDGFVAAGTQIAMFLRARILLERTARWLLRNLPRPLDVEAAIERFTTGFAELADLLPGMLGEAEASTARAIADELVQARVPRMLASRVAHLVALVPSPDLVQISEATGLSVPAVAQAYYALGARLELWWLRERIVALPRDSRWASMARAALRDDVYSEQAALTHQVMSVHLDGAAPLVRVDEWLAQNREGVDRCLRVLADIRTGGAVDLARLSVAVREVRNLIGTST